MFMVCRVFFFFFKQKTAYEMRISDWSSDVCSSDLAVKHVHHFAVEQAEVADIAGDWLGGDAVVDAVEGSGAPALQPAVAPAAAADGVHHFGAAHPGRDHLAHDRSEEHTSELQSLMRISYAVFCLTTKNQSTPQSTDKYV